MKTQFKTLFLVTIAHAYYSEQCEDIDFTIPSDTATLLLNGKLLARQLDGKLYVLFEADDTGAAMVEIPGKTLRFGLLLNNPYFANFTQLDTAFPSSKFLYRNTTATISLDPAQKVTLVGQVFSHTLTDTKRPATVTLIDAAGVTIQTDEITAAADRPTVSYDLTNQAPGAYTVKENYGASSKSIAYYSDIDSLRAGAIGIVEVKIDSPFYTTPPGFEIAFDARQETLKYYIVGGGTTKVSDLKVTDAGYSDDKRTQISFDKVLPADFKGSDISPDLLTSDSANLLLYKSVSLVTRTETTRKKIQLSNSEVLITNLPQPRPENSTADLIVPVS
jgi:hypothetical protein